MIIIMLVYILNNNNEVEKEILKLKSKFDSSCL